MPGSLKHRTGTARWSVGIVASAAVLLPAFGCKTQADAVAAASQMVTTAQTMSAYYTALDHVVAATQDAYQAQYALLSTPPLDLTETRDQIRLRAELATEVGDVASAFQKITASTAATDASAAAGSLNTEVTSLHGLASNDMEAKAVTLGVQAIVTLIQEHKEVEASRQVAPLCHQLTVFFDSESKLYDSLNQAYLLTARTVALKLVETDQVDSSAVFASSLQPFGLAPSISKEDTKKSMRAYLETQIRATYTIKLKESQQATEALSAALKEMDARIDLVAHDKPMSIRSNPFSLQTVNGWIEAITKST
jgi:hypothetical protein